MLNTKEMGGKTSKHKYKSRRRHSRSQESPVRLLLIQRNRPKYKIKTPDTPKKTKQHLPHKSIPKKQINDEYKHPESTQGQLLV